MGRNAVVIGAASGMGYALARRLCGDGYRVCIADVDEAKLNDAQRELSASGAAVSARTIDLLDLNGTQGTIDLIREDLGPIWLLAVTAGILEGSLAIDADMERFLRVIRINFEGVVAANIAVARHMVSDGQGGRIINWSSANAVGGTAGYSAYASSKAALDTFSASLAMEVGRYGITVNTIRPGSVTTPMLSELSEQEIAAECSRIPMGRFGTSDEVAAFAAFLASDDARWITGTSLSIDGGTVAAVGRPAPELVSARLARASEMRHG